jgi:hypothetical protein
MATNDSKPGQPGQSNPPPSQGSKENSKLSAAPRESQRDKDPKAKAEPRHVDFSEGRH